MTDATVTLAAPLDEVFTHLADPRCMGNWLPEVARIGAVPSALEEPFELTLRSPGGEIRGTGELIGYEPPRLVEYRLAVHDDVELIRLTCSWDGSATRVHVRQRDGAATAPLTVDLTRLTSLRQPVLGFNSRSSHVAF